MRISTDKMRKWERENKGKVTLDTNKKSRSTNDFLVLLDDLLDNLLDNGLALVFGHWLCVLGQLGIVCVLWETIGVLVLGQELLLPPDPSNPFVENTLALLDDGSVGDIDSILVLLVKLLGVLPEILAHLLLFFLAEKSGRARTPDELLELVGRVLCESLTGEGVDVPAILHLRGKKR